MVLKSRTRLHKLCSRALREKDPQKLAGLLYEIDGIFCDTMEELHDMLQQVEQMVKKMEESSRIHLT
jgi:hypothetical protein